MPPEQLNLQAISYIFLDVQRPAFNDVLNIKEQQYPIRNSKFLSKIA